MNAEAEVLLEYLLTSNPRLILHYAVFSLSELSASPFNRRKLFRKLQDFFNFFLDTLRFVYLNGGE